MSDKIGQGSLPFSKRDYKYFLVIQEVVSSTKRDVSKRVAQL